MKQLIEIVFHIFYCVLLPFSITIYLLVAINTCIFGENAFLDFLVSVVYGSIPLWVYIILGYVSWNVKLLTTYFARKMIFAHSIIILILMLFLITIILLTPIDLTRIPFLIIYTFFCLLPRTYMYVYKAIKHRKHKTRKPIKPTGDFYEGK